MKVRVSGYIALWLISLGLGSQRLQAQFLVDLIDTASNADKGLWAIYKKADHLMISGYFQPQFQVASEKGAKTFSGGDFAKNSNNRFMIRRGRIRFDYAHFAPDGKPQAQLVFQFDGSEKGVAIRDFWGRYYENRWELFSFTAGMFARPFGYEVNLGSGDRESPERARMSQTLMRTERDLGMMATFEPRKKSNRLRMFKIDLGVFNGQGLTGPDEYDSYKDLIGKISLKSTPVAKNILLSASASILEGGIEQNSKYVYRITKEQGARAFVVDSSLANLGRKAPRKYRGADAQLKFLNPWGNTELRVEYWWGTQSSAAEETFTPGLLLNEPYYIRRFQGTIFYFLQNVFSEKHQVGFKYDSYDPNIDLRGNAIGKINTNSHSGDVRFHTIGMGYTYWFSKQVKLVLWLDLVRNEKTSLTGYSNDIHDNVFTSRIQFRF